LDSIYAGIDQQNVYGRADFASDFPPGNFQVVINAESWAETSNRARRALRLKVDISDAKIVNWQMGDNGEQLPPDGATVALGRNFEFQLPLALLYALPLESSVDASTPAATKIRLRFSIWQNGLPVDALPIEGWVELQLLAEAELIALSH